MKYTFFSEITFSVILIILAVLFLDPFMVFMPTGVVYMLVGGIAIVFALFAGLVWKERAEDERDELHRMIAGRAGYILGVGVLMAGIIWQTVVSHPDPWLVAALVGMILGKLLGLYYGKVRR